MVSEQDQFLNIVDRDSAERSQWEVIRPEVLETDRVLLDEALGRVLAADVVAEIDLPGFDRSNADCFAVRAAETFGAAEESPQRLRLNPEEITKCIVRRSAVAPGADTAFATRGEGPARGRRHRDG